ncbi:putative bifunctional diguanylate cyclase/phosphodiesterase [Candidatus Reidiella endopervernicosa]|uniref:putative bifunctional diguanylate cyclase/phosphodiesterase n=1 Tax=Candidatus Reidiella endopervernicosa TaxID=2738883 RepID=UPI001EF15205|nr:GGDEF and EAL domain-containing protein [Candidatus Reidiella endopervernicosa]
MIISDAKNRVEMVNEAYCNITGYSRSEIIGNSPGQMKSGVHDADFYNEMWRTISETGCWSGEIWDKRKNGEIFPKWLSIRAIKDRIGHVRHFVGIFTDISELKEKELHLERLAYFDLLTAVPNRLQFSERLKQEIQAASRGDHQLAVLFIDLDRFKAVNDCYGHDIGDEVLKEAVSRMQSCVRDSDVLARLGGDEFTLLMTSGDAEQGAVSVADKIIDIISKPIVFDQHHIEIGVSVGISLFPRDGTNFEELMLNADRAMYHSKESGGGTITFANEALHHEVKRKLFLDNELRHALERNQFELHYQPQVEIASGRIIGMEALLRWNHPEEGPISPAEFIPRAESTMLMLPIGNWVLRTACQQLKQWHDSGLPKVPVAVNFSAAQFRHAGIMTEIEEALKDCDLAPKYLDVEITESASMRVPERTIEMLSQLKRLGIRCSIDDFGTGYSSLNYLKQFPVDKLKVDRSFVLDITKDHNDLSIVSAVLGLAKGMRLRVVAEGVEEEAQLELLRELGCDYIQGYYYSRPLPTDEMRAYLENSTAESN